MEEQISKSNFFTMFRDRFKNMILGNTLWTIVTMQLIIIFLILRPFLSPNFLSSKFGYSQCKTY